MAVPVPWRTPAGGAAFLTDINKQSATFRFLKIQRNAALRRLFWKLLLSVKNLTGFRRIHSKIARVCLGESGAGQERGEGAGWV